MGVVGDLDVVVLQAKLAKTDSWWSKDQYKVGPFVSLQLSGRVQKTKTCSSGKSHPTWSDKTKFEGVDPTSSFYSELHVKLMEKNAMEGDKEIASACVPLSRVYTAAPAPEDLTITLTTKQGYPAGELQLMVSFRPCAQPAAAQPQQQPAAYAAPVAPQAPAQHVYPEVYCTPPGGAAYPPAAAAAPMVQHPAYVAAPAAPAGYAAVPTVSAAYQPAAPAPGYQAGAYPGAYPGPPAPPFYPPYGGPPAV